MTRQQVLRWLLLGLVIGAIFGALAEGWQTIGWGIMFGYLVAAVLLANAGAAAEITGRWRWWPARLEPLDRFRGHTFMCIGAAGFMLGVVLVASL